jgi:hypothetical protein
VINRFRATMYGVIDSVNVAQADLLSALRDGNMSKPRLSQAANLVQSNENSAFCKGLDLGGKFSTRLWPISDINILCMLIPC